MTEDFDKDLEALAGDLDNLDLGDVAGEPEESASAEEGGGESVELDDDLQAMLGKSEGEPDDEPSLDDALAGLGDEPSAGETPSAAPAPRPAAPAKAPPPPPITASLSDDQAVNLEFLLDIKLHVTFEVGRSKMLISDLLTLGQGSVIELHRLVGDELDLLVNGKLVAKGEVVVVNEKFGCKITDIIPPEDRVKHLGSI